MKTTPNRTVESRRAARRWFCDEEQLKRNIDTHGSLLLVVPALGLLELGVDHSESWDHWRRFCADSSSELEYRETVQLFKRASSDAAKETWLQCVVDCNDLAQSSSLVRGSLTPANGVVQLDVSWTPINADDPVNPNIRHGDCPYVPLVCAAAVSVGPVPASTRARRCRALTLSLTQSDAFGAFRSARL